MAELIIAGDNKDYVLVTDGDTNDIIKVIEIADHHGIDYVTEFAHSIEGANVYETCSNLWDYVKNTIPYQEDGEGHQRIQLPGQLYNNRYIELGGTGKGGDCKSMALFCSSVLRALGNYNFKYRFISETTNADVHHVYLIVAYQDENGQPCYITLDCTLDAFNQEVDFAKKIDRLPSKPDAPAPHVGEFNFFKIGALTEKQFEDNMWVNLTRDMQKNFWALRQRLISEGVVRIVDKNKAHPIKTSEFVKAFAKNFDLFLDAASSLMYVYWNDKTLLPYYLCQLDATHPVDIPFPQQYDLKRFTGQQFYQVFETLGLTPAQILTLISLGVYKNYGTTLEYMLYRCYCLELYGQPFKPHPGIPYYNNTTGVFMVNDANPDDAVKIFLCLPAQGGIGRPFGIPYWSAGGNIISNGAEEGVVAKWANVNPKPGTPIDGDLQNLVPGVIVTELTLEEQKEALKVYNRWAAGNMVMLPQPQHVGDGKIGVGAIGEIVSIVVAVISAIIAVVTMVVKLVAMFKHPQSAEALALPLTDFKWDFQTKDGCIIGHCIATSGCNGTQLAKMCNGQIVELNPNVNDPKNQPAAAGSAFTGTKPANKKLYLGAAALALGAGAIYYSE